MPPNPPRGTGLMAPCWYSRVFYSTLLATSIIIEPLMPLDMLQLVKSLPIHIPRACKKYPFWAQPPPLGHSRDDVPMVPTYLMAKKEWDGVKNIFSQPCRIKFGLKIKKGPRVPWAPPLWSNYVIRGGLDLSPKTPTALATTLLNFIISHIIRETLPFH